MSMAMFCLRLSVALVSRQYYEHTRTTERRRQNKVKGSTMLIKADNLHRQDSNNVEINY